MSRPPGKRAARCLVRAQLPKAQCQLQKRVGRLLTLRKACDERFEFFSSRFVFALRIVRFAAPVERTRHHALFGMLLDERVECRERFVVAVLA
jgi:hypothetical protein